MATNNAHVEDLKRKFQQFYSYISVEPDILEEVITKMIHHYPNTLNEEDLLYRVADEIISQDMADEIVL